MYKVTFVILHYQSIEDTKECIKSIEDNIEYEEYNIIIVDNASPNKTGEELKKYYSNNDKIHCILNDKNLGFAKGNNIGFRYAKLNLKSDFIIVINSDTIIKQKEFIKILIDKYMVSKFHILGPDIETIFDKVHQNPQRLCGLSKKEIYLQIIRFNILLFFNNIMIENKIRFIMSKVKREKSKSEKFVSSEKWDVQLHGSCLIFSKDYINEYNGFEESTFMYGEEDILYYICKRDNLRILYYPRMKIYHKEDGATNSTFKVDSVKRKFIYRNSLNSLNALLKLMK